MPNACATFAACRNGNCQSETQHFQTNGFERSRSCNFRTGLKLRPLAGVELVAGCYWKYGRESAGKFPPKRRENKGAWISKLHERGGRLI
jgi:hypothetical protein